MYIIRHEIGHYVQRELPLVICFSLNMKACCEYCCFLVGCITFYGHIKSSRTFFFYSQVKDACFHWWARFLLLSRLQQYIVLMVRDLYRPDACLYSTKREDLAWGRYYSSFSDRAKWALLSTMDNWHHSTQFYLKATKHKPKMQRITLKKTFNMWSFFYFLFFIFLSH